MTDWTQFKPAGESAGDATDWSQFTPAAKRGLVNSPAANDIAPSDPMGSGFAETMAVAGPSKSGSVLEDLPADTFFNAAASNFLSVRKNAEQSEAVGRGKGANAAPITGKTIPINTDGTLRRAASLASGQLDQYAAGLGYKLGDAAEAVGAKGAAANLKGRAAALMDRADTGSQSISLSADGAFEKYAPQILAVFPTMAIAAASGGLPVMFGVAEMQAYSQGRKAGLTPGMALGRAVPMAAAEVLGEKLGGTGKLLTALEKAVVKGGTLGSLRELSGRMLASGMREVPSEEATYAMQFGIDKAPGIGLRPDAGVSEFIDGAIDTAIVSAGAGGMMAGGGMAINRLTARERTFAEKYPVPPDNVPAVPPAPVDPVVEIGKAQNVEQAITAAQTVLKSAAAVDNISQILQEQGLNRPASPTNTPLSDDLAAVTQGINELEANNAEELQPTAQPISATFTEAPAADPVPKAVAARNAGLPGSTSPLLETGATQPDQGALNGVLDGANPTAGTSSQAQAETSQAPEAGAVDSAEFSPARDAAGASQLQSDGLTTKVNQPVSQSIQAQAAIQNVAPDFTKDLTDARNGLADLQVQRKAARGTKRADLDAQIGRVESTIKELESNTERAQAAPETIAQEDAIDPQMQRAAAAKTGLQRKAKANRLRDYTYNKSPFLAFLGKNGVALAQKRDFSPDKNPMLSGYGPLFRTTGKSTDVLLQNAIEENFLPEGSDSAALDQLITQQISGMGAGPAKRIEAIYSPEVADRVMNERMQEAQDTYEQEMTSQQQAADNVGADPFGALTALDYTESDADAAGYNDADNAVQLEVNALLLTAEKLGIDTEEINYQAFDETRTGTQQDYLAAAKAALQSAIAAVEGSSGNSRQDVGQSSPAAKQEVSPSAAAFEAAPKADGTLAVKGDAAAIRETLKDIPAKSLMNAKGGVLVGRTQADKAAAILNGDSPKITAREAAEAGQAAREADKKAKASAARIKPASQGLSIGFMPGSAEAVTVKDGLVYVGKYPAQDYDTAGDVTVPNGATDEQIVQALRDAGAIAKRQRVFGLAKPDAPTSEGLTAPTQQDVLDKQDRATAGDKANTSQRKAEQEKMRLAAERKDIAKASETAADRFELGGDAMQNLTGQGGLQFSRADASLVGPMSPNPSKTPLYEAMRQLARMEDSFQTNTSKSKELPDIAKQIVKTEKGSKARTFVADIGTALHQGNRKPTLTLSITMPNSDTVKLLDIFNADTDRPFVVIGNSDAGQKVGGATAYQIAFAWAHNNGKTMRPDPAGLTVINRLRRTEAMISSAMHYGTTKHLEPHQDQYVAMLDRVKRGGKEPEDTHYSGRPDIYNELEALKKALWTSKSDDASIATNVQHLLESSTQLTYTREPATKNFEVVGGEFRVRSGRDGALSLANRDAAGQVDSKEILGVVLRPAASGVGPSTLRRAAVSGSVMRAYQQALQTNNLGRQNSGDQQPDVAAIQAIRQTLGKLDLSAPEGLSGLFYSGGTATRTPSTVAKLQAAVTELIGGKQLPNQLGRVVVTTAAEIKSHWQPQLKQNVQLDSAGEAGQAQAFYDPRTKTVFLIADNIPAGDETAVAAHELMHKHGQAVLGEAGWNRLHSTINTWANAEEGTPERDVYTYASNRVKAVGQELSSQEMFPYAVEAAIKMGIKPSMAAKRGTVASWLESVRQNMAVVWGKVTGKPGNFRTQDLVDLAFGIAQMENTKRAGAVRDALREPTAPDSGGAPIAQTDIRYSIREVLETPLPDAIIGSTLGTAAASPQYALAKSGDVNAAFSVAKLLVTPGLVAKVKAAIGKETPMVVPVVSIEAAGKNKLPLAAAELLAAKLGLDVDTAIIQSSSPKRTAMTGLNQILSSPEFEGDVVAGQSYVLVDDTLTQGATFAALASHIQAGGGKVMASVALTSKAYSAKLAPSTESITALRTLHGTVEPNFKAATGYGFDGLTQSEVRYLTNFAPTATVRDRFIAAGNAARQATAAGANQSVNSAGGNALANTGGSEPTGKQQVISTTRQPLPANKALSPWRDETGRIQFAPGQWLYNQLGQAAAPMLVRLGMKAASPELRRQLRQMKIEVQKAQDVAVSIAKETSKMTEDERAMVSDLVEQELKVGVIPPAHAVKLAAMINNAMERQTDELVSLGMLTKDSADKWRGKYLPRFYESKLKDKLAKTGATWADALMGLTGRTSAMKGIKGKNLKGRGLYETIAEADLPNYEALGWEVRDPDYIPSLPTVDGTVQVWRDFSPAEREKMGEIRDAGFRFVMGYMQTQRDIALGRMFEAMAQDPDQSSRLEKEGYVQVPTTVVSGTGAKVYGKLAGRWVPTETLSQLSSIEESTSEAWQMYRNAMAIWKQGKTSMNPVSHVNNVVSNLTMAHLAGVGYLRGDKYIAAARDFVKKTPMLQEAKDNGLFLGTISDSELMDTMPEELRLLAQKQETTTLKVARTGFDILTMFLRKPMGAAYQAEDTFFRYLIYKDARDRGVDPQDAVDYAQRFIFTYDDLPKGARMVRDFGIPFFSYTYKAVPALLHTTLTHPLRMAAPAAVLWGINAAAYAIATGDDDDDWQESLTKYLTDEAYRDKVRNKEKLERELLPSWNKGTTALMTPKMIRLGQDEVTKLPLFIDVSRIIPGGDMFDVSPNAGGIPLPQTITPSHPLFTTAVAMLGNKDLFRGKELVDKNDTRGEAAEKRLGWLWTQLSPAVAAGNYHWQRGMNALAQANGGEVKWVPDFLGGDATGIGKDGLPVQPKYAAMQTFGIKVRPMDLDTSAAIDRNMQNKMVRDIDTELSALKRLANKGAVNERSVDKARELASVKKDRINQGLTVDGDEKK